MANAKNAAKAKDVVAPAPVGHNSMDLTAVGAMLRALVSRRVVSGDVRALIAAKVGAGLTPAQIATLFAETGFRQSKGNGDTGGVAAATFRMVQVALRGAAYVAEVDKLAADAIKANAKLNPNGAKALSNAIGAMAIDTNAKPADVVAKVVSEIDGKPAEQRASDRLETLIDQIKRDCVGKLGLEKRQATEFAGLIEGLSKFVKA